MSWVMVDIEADGPIPGDYSMTEIGAVIIDKDLDKKFHGFLCPISNKYIPEALSVSGYSREETLSFPCAKDTMLDFKRWLRINSKGNPMFIADNNGFDWMFVCWYFHHFVGENPFGFSSTNLGSLAKGCMHDIKARWKHLRKTKHNHNPVDDAVGNAEAFLKLNDIYKLEVL